MNYRIVWLLSLLVVFVPGSGAKLTAVPENIAVVEGDVVIMNCMTDTDDKLLWRIANETHVSSLYTGNKFTINYRDCCEINNSTKGELTLKVRTRKDLPLHYVCEEPGGKERSGADLVVLESNPRCGVVDDGRDLYSSVKMWCSVIFFGNWTPVMQWEMISTAGNKSTVDIDSINTTCTNNAVNSNIIITAHAGLDGCKYTCTTSFPEFSLPPKRSVAHITWPVANNVPKYSFTWESNTLHVITVSNVSWIRLNSSVSRSVGAIITPIIAAICVAGGVFLLIRFTSREQRMYLISRVTPKPRTAELTEQNGGHVENDVIPTEDHTTHTDSSSTPQKIDQAAPVNEADALPTIPDVVEECRNEPDMRRSSQSATKLRSKGYVEMRGIRKTLPANHRGITKSEYVMMDPARKTIGPPKPPRASHTEEPSTPTKTDWLPTPCTPPPKKPPRASDATEYVELNIARACARGAAPPPPSSSSSSKNPMYSRVEVYASIDHSATVSPTPSKLS